MMRAITKNLALLTALAVSGLVVGCNPPPPSGSARVGVAFSALSAKTVAKVTLTVGPGNGNPAFPSIVTDLTNQDLVNNLKWTGFVQQIPAGSGRSFHVDALDAMSNVLYSGDTNSDIVAGKTAMVFLVLQEKDPHGGFENYLPVVDSLTASANIVSPGAQVALSVTAHSPNQQPDPLTYAWVASCGTLTNATSTQPTWTAPAVPPPQPTACEISVTVSDAHDGHVVASLNIVYQVSDYGSAQVNAYPNSWPMITGIYAKETFTKDQAGKIVALDVDLIATAGDPDADDIQYSWSSPNCIGQTTGFTSANVQNVTANLVEGPAALGKSTVHFHSHDPSHGCVIAVHVTDFWTNSIPPVGSGLLPARGGDTLGLINASTPQDFVIGPQITGVTQPNAGNQVQPGQTVTLGVNTLDPTPQYNKAQTPFVYAWTATVGTLANQSDITTSPGKSTIQWTAPNPLVAGMSVTVKVTNAAGLSTSYTFVLVPSNICSQPNSDGQPCDTGLGLCGPNGACNAGACVSPNPVTCAASDQCHDVGVCNPGDGKCSNPPKQGTPACNLHNGCFTGQVCMMGTCLGTAVVCNTPPNACYQAAGVCQSTGDVTFTCGYTPQAKDTPCSDSNKCFQAYACDGLGTCAGSSPVVCPVATTCATAAACDKADGLCKGSVPQNVGQNCDPGDLCLTGGMCTVDGLCGGQPFCGAGQSCVVANGAPKCTATDVVPQLAKGLSMAQFNGLAQAADGTSYVAGPYYPPAAKFDGIDATQSGGADALVVAYDPNTRKATWVKSLGDGSDQLAYGTAITADNTVAVLGTFQGVISADANAINLNNPGTAIDFVVGLDGANKGKGKWGNAYDNGSGQFLTMAANPTLNTIAVCGYATKAVPWINGAVYSAGQDVVIALLDSAGKLKWAREIGGAGDELCSSIAVNDDGDVYAAGQYNGAPDFGLGKFTDPASGFRHWLWVAKLAGNDGHTIANTTFGSGNGNHKPLGMTIDAAKQLLITGSFTQTLPFGNASLVSAGNTDVFVAKLDGTTLASAWAVRMGSPAADEGHSVAVDSFGEPVVVGLFNQTTTGVAALTASGNAASDAFVLKLGSDGTLQYAHAYGDASAQTADRVAINRIGVGPVKDLVEIGGFASGTIDFGNVAGSVSWVGGNSFLVFEALQ